MGTLDTAVVGGGLAGLTAAIALAQRGHRVNLYESTRQWKEVGAGITLAPNAMRGLDHLGVGEAVAHAGTEPRQQTISHWQDGRVLLSLDRSGIRKRYNAAYVYIHRADLHRILVAAAEQAGVALHLAHRLVSVDVHASGASMVFDNMHVAKADLVVAADGLHSQVRKLFRTEPPYFTGHVAYRALAPATADIQPLIDQPGIHIGPGRMAVRYPLRGGSLLNLVFFARQEGWTDDGWSIPAAADELSVLFDDWCEDVRALIRAAAPDTLFKWAINAHHPLPGWSLGDRVVLVGDAAHAMTPFLGQGAAAGIEDAVILARALDLACAPGEALAHYEVARIERTRFIQAESNANADRLQGPEAELYGLGKLRNEETLGLFDYDCWTTSVGGSTPTSSHPSDKVCG